MSNAGGAADNPDDGLPRAAVMNWKDCKLLTAANPGSQRGLYPKSLAELESPDEGKICVERERGCNSFLACPFK